MSRRNNAHNVRDVEITIVDGTEVYLSLKLRLNNSLMR